MHSTVTGKCIKERALRSRAAEVPPARSPALGVRFVVRRGPERVEPDIEGEGSIDRGSSLAIPRRVNETSERPRCVTGGLDIGARSVKAAILSHHGAQSSVVTKAVVQITGCRNVLAAMRASWGQVLAEANLSARDVDFVASTGLCDSRDAHVGPFYGHLSHALGAQLLFPDATVVLDVGANQVRCDLLSAPSNRQGVLSRKDAGYGDSLLEAPADQPAAAPDEQAEPPAAAGLTEKLAEHAATILHGLAIDGKVVLTGGMVLDPDFVHGLWRRLLGSESNIALLVSPDGIFAGAYGAAILAARRFDAISHSFDPVVARPFLPHTLGRHDRSLN